MAISKFDTYISLKKNLLFQKKGIDFNRVLTPELIDLAYSRELTSRLKFSLFFKLIFRQVSFKAFASTFDKNDIIVTNVNDRKDTLELIEAVVAELKRCKHFKLSSIDRYVGFNFGLLHLLEVLSFFFLRYKARITVLEKLYLSCSTIYYINLLYSLELAFKNKKLDNKVYVAFNSAYDIEALITLFFKTKGVKTVHLSHGLTYVKYKDFQPFDCVNGENINSDNVFVWGKSSLNDLEQNYPETFKKVNICVAGNPKYKEKQIDINFRFEKCVVFLPRDIYEEHNFKLLKILGDFSGLNSVSFFVKLHPFTDENKYESILKSYGMTLIPKNMTINEVLGGNKYDFAITFNSTVYYEAMYFNLLCFRYAVVENEMYTGLDDKFNSSHELLEKINNFKAIGKEELNNKVIDLLKSTIGLGVNRYNELANLK